MTRADGGGLTELLCGADSTPWLVLPDERRMDDRPRVASIGDIRSQALALAGRLPGLADRGAPVLLIFDNGEPFVVAFFACLFAGMVPVPLATPHLAQDRDAYLRRIRAVATDAGASLLLTDAAIRARLGTDPGARIVTLAEVAASSFQGAPRPTEGQETALVQYTSGSTGPSNGVELAHDAVLHNVHGIGTFLGASDRDVGVSWLPLFHDMGLVGSLLFTLAYRMPLVVLRPTTFAFHPLAWLRAVSRFRGTLSPAPTSAYRLCVSRARPAELSALDLSSWRVGLVGAEMVEPGVLRAFSTTFAGCGFRGALTPAYGLAENVLAVALSSLAVAPRVDHVSRRASEELGLAVPEESDTMARDVVGVGHPLAGQELRVTDEAGVDLGERRIGEIEVRGPCVMKGYRGNPSRTADVLRADGWLRTGDRGYLVGGELFVLGRRKDLIRRFGSSYDAGAIEAAVRDVPGVREGRVAAFGVADTDGSERLVVAVETSVVGAPSRLALCRDATAAVAKQCGVRPDHVLCVRPGRLPRTTSGKVQRYQCRQAFESGALMEPPADRCAAMETT